MKNRVKDLRASGYIVGVKHMRPYLVNGSLWGMYLTRADAEEFTNSRTELYQKGGKTEVTITTPDGKTVTGVAVCSPKETFNRKISLDIALGRALKCLERGIDRLEPEFGKHESKWHTGF